MPEPMDIVENPPQHIDGWKTLVTGYEQRSMVLRAYDAAERALEAFPGDKWLQHRAVLALARSDATETALARFKEYELSGEIDEEIASLSARLAKDLVWLASGDDRIEKAKAAADAYERVYTQTGGYYPGINAATLRLIAGDGYSSCALARRLLGELESTPSGRGLEEYYRLATFAEAHLLLGETKSARTALESAIGIYDKDLSARATTRRQLRRICLELEISDTFLDVLAAKRVMHFTGHIIAAPQTAGRFTADGECQAAAMIAAHLDKQDIGFGYGSIACGADILFAEALLNRGGELNIVLPFQFDEFLDTSVRTGKAKWETRARDCIRKATTVTYATEDRHLGDDALFGYASRLAMGLALLRSQYLDSEVEQVALWDGEAARGTVGTAVDAALWKRLGFPQKIISCPKPDPNASPATPSAIQKSAGRVSRAMLFGDIKGFSKLNDQQLPLFIKYVLGGIAKELDRYDVPLLFRNTWGDGLYLVFDDLCAAARCALDLQIAMANLPLKDIGLPDHISLRLGGHLGPVYESLDPIVGNTNFFGAHVSRAARIEPITPEGSVYVTEHFAAGLTVEANAEFNCNYVGTVPAAKNFGDLQMYLLRRK